MSMKSLLCTLNVVQAHSTAAGIPEKERERESCRFANCWQQSHRRRWKELVWKESGNPHGLCWRRTSQLSLCVTSVPHPLLTARMMSSNVKVTVNKWLHYYYARLPSSHFMTLWIVQSPSYAFTALILLNKPLYVNFSLKRLCSKQRVVICVLSLKLYKWKPKTVVMLLLLLQEKYISWNLLLLRVLYFWRGNSCTNVV